MKSIKNIIALWLLCIGLSVFGQGSQLITTILPVNGGIVLPGQTFRIDVSVTYNTIEYSNYRLKMELPDHVSWSQQFTTDVNSLQISGITGGGDEFLIPFTPLESGIKSTNFYLDNLVNGTEAICVSAILSDINFTLLATQGGNQVTVATSVNVVTTPKKEDVIGSVNLSVSHGQELLGGTNTGTFPYYVDIFIDWSNLKDLPALTLAIPGNKLDVITAVRYNVHPPFHSEFITLGTPVINGTTETYPVPLPSSVSSYSHGGNAIRVYFSSSVTGTLSASEIEVSTTGATYELCNLTVQNVPDKNVHPSSDHALVTQTGLYQSIEEEITNFSFCAQRCDFNLNDYTAKFYFEINSIYTQFGSTVPRVRVQCPYTFLRMKNLEVPAGISSVKYAKAGSSNELMLTVTNGIATFPNDDIQYIYIDNYTPANTGDFAKDFAVNFSSKVSVFSAGTDAQRRFSITYQDNFPNTNVYTSEPVIIDPNCQPGLRIIDHYRNEAQDFVDNVNYLPETVHDIRLTISPIDVYYTSNYTVSNAEYVLNPNMIQDGGNTVLLYSDHPTNGFRPILSFQQVTLPFGAMRAQWSADGTTIRIQYINMLSLHQFPGQCGSARTIYLKFSVKVKKNTPYIQGGYRSTVLDPNQDFTRIDYSTWNIERSTIDKVSAAISLLCPEDQQVYDKFIAGQTVMVRYKIHNENQNPVKDLNYEIPGINNGVLVGGVDFGNVKIQAAGSLTDYRSAFAINAQGNGIRIVSDPSYVLNGFTELFVYVRYKLNTDLSLGTTESGITFNLDSYNSIDGVARALTNPAQKSSYTIVAETQCVDIPCDSCITSFSPIPGHEYLLSAWVKEDFNSTNAIRPKTYVNSGIQISFNDGFIANTPLFVPKGPIIDGWQRIEASFIVPDNAYNIHIEMVNNGKNEAFFDDIRIHPFRSNMKSFVYDPSTQRLVSELDENNYATFYEYDDEGALIRVKKETQRGVMTITESRNNQSKIR